MLAVRSYVLLLLGVWAVSADPGPLVNSLTYIYTAFSRQPVNLLGDRLEGIHTFSAMGLLDGRVIDYYDSDTKVKEPRETWMKERLEADYWSKGSASRKTKEQWFRVNLDILTKRLMKNDTDNHVLQWRHGCTINAEGPKEPKGIDQYSYDGDDFLSFDSKHKQWVAPMSAAEQTKAKWDKIQQLNDYTDGYLHKECVQWLETFLKYRTEANKNSSKPEVFLYAKPTQNNALKLSCMATGFYPKTITLNIKRDGRELDRFDGLKSTGVRPNGDGTHQIKKWVKIPKTDKANYTCEVIHLATSEDVVTREWDHQVDILEQGDSSGAIIGAVAAVVIILVLVGITAGAFIMRRRNAQKTSKGSTETVESGNPSPNGSSPLLKGSLKSVDSGNPSSTGSGTPTLKGSLKSVDSGNLSPPGSGTPTPKGSLKSVDSVNPSPPGSGTPTPKGSTETVDSGNRTGSGCGSVEE